LYELSDGHARFTLARIDEELPDSDDGGSGTVAGARAGGLTERRFLPA
jgi:hypothetical protein